MKKNVELLVPEVEWLTKTSALMPNSIRNVLDGKRESRKNESINEKKRESNLLVNTNDNCERLEGKAIVISMNQIKINERKWNSFIMAHKRSPDIQLETKTSVRILLAENET